MYRAFNLQLEENALKAYAADRTKYEYEKSNSKEVLAKLIASEDTVSASEIKNILFPQTQSFNIFLSHSHNDLDLALRVKEYLENELGLTVFIDSVYWDNINELQDILNEYHRNRVSGLFNHQKTMDVAVHANMILASALTEMIDRCECVFFLNTDNSVIKGEDVVEGNDATYSPWIYHEIYTTTIIKTKINRDRVLLEHMDSKLMFCVSSMPSIQYGLDLENMDLIDEEDLDIWLNVFLQKNRERDIHALDVLYFLCSLSDNG